MDNTLKVPGATLHYWTEGSGPVLLMIPGGAADSTMFGRIAPLMADRYTVITYDPRGLSRSTLDGPPSDVPIPLLADDAFRLLSTVTSEPAYVLGSSGGALTGLSLVVEHPGLVHTLVAHEPPLTYLLPDHESQQAIGRSWYETYHREGPDAGMAKFFVDTGIVSKEDLAAWEVPEQMRANFGQFLGHMLMPSGEFRADIPALRASSTRIVVGGGASSKGQRAELATVAFAEEIGLPLVEFPGDHGGFDNHAEEFAKALGEVLARG